jgi:hypothetical protein
LPVIGGAGVVAALALGGVVGFVLDAAVGAPGFALGVGVALASPGAARAISGSANEDTERTSAGRNDLLGLTLPSLAPKWGGP